MVGRNVLSVISDITTDLPYTGTSEGLEVGTEDFNDIDIPSSRKEVLK
jgi:hypothetical protein